MLVAAAFAVLLAASALVAGASMFRRTATEWLIDGTGLIVQGAIAVLIASPFATGELEVAAVAQFLISFVLVDYAFYWNHRLLHGALWRWHAVHHTASRLDVLVSSRNTLWAPLLMVYIWSNVAAVALLRDPRGWLLGVSLTAALDLWRHSPLTLPAGVRRVASLLIITPHEHGWHHSSEQIDVNFGANLSVWDRLHGTYAAPLEQPASFGVAIEGGTARRLLVGVR